MAEAGSFLTFPARFYLEKYYSGVGAENEAFMRAVAESGREAGKLETVVEIGGGPSLCGMLAMAAGAEEGPERVVWVDIAPSNLAEVGAWLEDAEGAFEYAEVLRWIEGELDVDSAKVVRRLRGADWEMHAVDLWKGLPADLAGAGDVVGSYFFAEAATGLEDGFIGLTASLAEAAAPGARLALAYIRRSQPYHLNDDAVYPAFSVDENSIPSLLERAGLDLEDLQVMLGPRDEPPARPGYDGMVFVSGRLPPSPAAVGHSKAAGTNM